MTNFARLKNKILILSIFIFCFFVSAFALSYQTRKVNALQDYTPVITVENKTVHRGQTFTIDVDLSENQGLTALYITLSYDTSVMQLVGIKNGNALTHLTLQTDNVETEQGYNKEPFNLFWADEAQDTSNGTIITLEFESFSSAQPGEYPVNFTYRPENTRQDYEQPIEIEINNGIVTIIEGAFKVYYLDWDYSELFSKDYNDGEIPSYPYDNPVREEDDEYSYEFYRWKGLVIDEPTGPDDQYVIKYQAEYKKTAQEYTLMFLVDGYGDENEPDGIIDIDKDYYASLVVSFDEYIQTITPGDDGYYKFVGWFWDDEFTKSFLGGTMPSHDLKLYGYYEFDLRERNIPQITLKTTNIGEDFAVVTARLTKNTGFNYVRLSLEFDTTALTLTSFSEGEVMVGLRFKNTDSGYVLEYQSGANNYETGLFLTMTFSIQDETQKGTYFVTFNYNEHSDATYLDNGESKYTKIDIISAEVPIGTISHWNDTIGGHGGVEIDVFSKDDQPINVKLFIELITDEVDLSDETIAATVGENYGLSSAYRVRLVQNGEDIEPHTTLTIKISFNNIEKRCKNVKFYRINKDGELQVQKFKTEGDLVVFDTDSLGEWAIFTDFADKGSGIQNYALFIILPTLLALASMAYALIIMGKKHKH